MIEALKIFVGTEPKQWLASEVLRYSLLRRTSSPIDFQELKHLPIPRTFIMKTGFSVYRFAIPEVCQFQGKAVYLDADCVVLSDINDLFNLDMGSHGALARPMNPLDPLAGRYTNVMLLDCTKLIDWKLDAWWVLIDRDPDIYIDTMWARRKGLSTEAFGDLPDSFNHFDLVDSSTKIVRFTPHQAQPWRRRGHPFAHVFLKELKDAMEENEIPADAILREIQYGHIYPEILQDLSQL